MLLFPAERVVVTVKVEEPPGTTNGQGEPGPAPELFGSGPAVAVTRFLLTGVTLVKGTARSGMPSPFVSKLAITAVVTVLPARAMGTVISGLAASPVLGDAQMVVASLAKNPVPIRLIVTDG